MIITIYEGYDKSEILVGSKDERFRKAWGNVCKVNAKNTYSALAELSAWVNNELGEECLFEID